MHVVLPFLLTDRHLAPQRALWYIAVSTLDKQSFLSDHVQKFPALYQIRQIFYPHAPRHSPSDGGQKTKSGYTSLPLFLQFRYF